MAVKGLRHLATDLADSADVYPRLDHRHLCFDTYRRPHIASHPWRSTYLDLYLLYAFQPASVFVDEFLNPEKVTEKSYAVYPNANKTWTRGEDRLLLAMYQEGKDIKYISRKMGRSQTSIIMRLGKLGAR